MNEIIKKKFRNSDVILESRQFSFAAKLAMLRAKNYIPQTLYSDFRLLNSLRNKFSHDLFYNISEFDMSKFSYCDSLAMVYDEIIETEETLPLINLYMLKTLALDWLLKLTSSFTFIAKLRMPPQRFF